jgi:hypothetical protein
MKINSFKLEPNVPTPLTEIFGKLPEFKHSEDFVLHIYKIDNAMHLIR